MWDLEIHFNFKTNKLEMWSPKWSMYYIFLKSKKWEVIIIFIPYACAVLYQISICLFGTAKSNIAFPGIITDLLTLFLINLRRHNNNVTGKDWDLGTCQKALQKHDPLPVSKYKGLIARVWCRPGSDVLCTVLTVLCCTALPASDTQTYSECLV